MYRWLRLNDDDLPSFSLEQNFVDCKYDLRYVVVQRVPVSARLARINVYQAWTKYKHNVGLFELFTRSRKYEYHRRVKYPKYYSLNIFGRVAKMCFRV